MTSVYDNENCTLLSTHPGECVTKHVSYTCDRGDCLSWQCPESTQYTCDCPDGYYGQTCEYQCDLQCLNNGTCRTYRSVMQFCDCVDGWSGTLCDEVQPDNTTTSTPYLDNLPVVSSNTSHTDLSVVVSVVVVCVLIIASVVALMVYLWKNRIGVIFKITEVLYKRKTKKMDQGAYKYDAFVSYKCCQPDEMFVTHILQPKLEAELNYKLCLHYKHFTAGNDISDNIVEAIENSRYSILVISPDYVTAMWTKLEYHYAQTAMLKQRHKIIPIIYRNIAECEKVDATLELLLKSITYVEWPGATHKEQCGVQETFWKKLSKALGKPTCDSTTMIEDGEKPIGEYVLNPDELLDKISYTGSYYSDLSDLDLSSVIDIDTGEVNYGCDVVQHV